MSDPPQYSPDGRYWWDGQTWQPVAGPAVVAQPSPHDPSQNRSAILQSAIGGYVKAGYRVTSQTETTAQLVKPKKFSFIWALLWFLVVGVGLLVYLFYYASKKDQQIYLEVTPEGKLRTTQR